MVHVPSQSLRRQYMLHPFVLKARTHKYGVSYCFLKDERTVSCTLVGSEHAEPRHGQAGRSRRGSTRSVACIFCSLEKFQRAEFVYSDACIRDAFWLIPGVVEVRIDPDLADVGVAEPLSSPFELRTILPHRSRTSNFHLVTDTPRNSSLPRIIQVRLICG